MKKTASIVGADGKQSEITLEASMYQAAHDSNLSVPQYLNNKYPTDSAAHGTAFAQLCASVGLFQSKNKEFGIRPPTVHQALEGTGEMQVAGIVREASPASRILFPAVILELIENKLSVDRQSAPAIFDQMIAVDQTIAGARAEQPVVNYSRPEAARSQPIGQLAEPSAMLTITTSDIVRKLPTFALGLEMSDEAMKASTLDLVTLAIARQTEVERAARVDEYLAAFLAGDADHGQLALSVTQAKVYDAAITVIGTLTHKAWVKYLYNNSKKRTIDWVVCDLDAALVIESRTGKPIITSDDPNSPRIDALAQIANPAIQNVKIFLVEDGVVPANTIMGLDSRYAIQRIRNSEAEYSAVERFVLRKGSALRFDFSEIAYRLFDEAFDVLELTVA